MPLEKELATYEKMKADLLKTHNGKFVLIHGEDCQNVTQAENAYGEGVEALRPRAVPDKEGHSAGRSVSKPSPLIRADACPSLTFFTTHHSTERP